MRLAAVLAAGLVAAITASFVASGAAARESIRPAPGAPDPRQMVLLAQDLGGARVTAQSYYKDRDFPSVISYLREFENGRTGGTVLSYVASEAEVGIRAEVTASYLTALRRVFGTKQGRAVLVKLLPTGTLVTQPKVGRPRNLGVGPGSFDLLLTFKVLGRRTDAHISAFSVDQVLGYLITVGIPGRPVPLGVMTHLATVMATRMRAQLVPTNTVLPSISGTAQVGETLTATPGTWSGNPATFSYQWQRCDPQGASCADIPAATSQAYVLSDADVGHTIRVVVMAQNEQATATATSPTTPVVLPVPAPGSPRVVVRPSILGVAQVGQTLTAATGTWTGNPTSFSFLWVRCPADLVGCGEALPGATQGTYLVQASDVGTRIWVDVTAGNEFGRTRTSSAPTAPVVP